MERIMDVKFHPHAEARMVERGATREEVISTVENGEQFSAKYGRIGFRRTFNFSSHWNRKFYDNKQLEVFAVEEEENWLVITVIVKYF